MTSQFSGGDIVVEELLNSEELELIRKYRSLSDFRRGVVLERLDFLFEQQSEELAFENRQKITVFSNMPSD